MRCLAESGARRSGTRGTPRSPAPGTRARRRARRAYAECGRANWRSYSKQSTAGCTRRALNGLASPAGATPAGIDVHVRRRVDAAVVDAKPTHEVGVRALHLFHGGDDQPLIAIVDA